jgi:hypothetical protein
MVDPPGPARKNALRMGILEHTFFLLTHRKGAPELLPTAAVGCQASDGACRVSDA